MRQTNENSLKEVIEQLLDLYKLRDRLNEVRIREAWDKVMDASIARRTSSLRIKKDTLYISISSAPLREELQYQKQKIAERMNEELGGNFLNEIVIQ